jgi:DNA repair exonuclease SbcCD ATPase subunit
MKAWPDWDEFLRRLREDPVFREEVRRQVLTEDLLNLPAVVSRVLDLQGQTLEAVRGMAAAVEAFVGEVRTAFGRVEAQIASLTEQVRENSRQIASLTERMDRLEGQMAALTERMDRAEAQIQENSRQIAALTEQVRENSRQIAALTEALREFREAAERRFAALEREVAGLRQDVGDLKGTALEVWWAQYAPSYLGRWFRKVRVLTREALNDELDAAEDEGRLTAEDAEEVRRADVVAVARDRKTREEVWVVMEVSATVGLEDVTRAKRRADILAHLGRRAVAIAVGREARPPVRAKARGLGVWVIEDGRRTVPDDSSLRQTSE